MPTTEDTQRAFPSHPRVDRYFATEANEAHRRRLVELLTRGDGPGLVIAAPGVGKSMIIEAIAAELAPPLRVVRLTCTQLCTRRALLQAILRGLDLPYTNRDEGQLRLGLIDGLESINAPVALLVDEAQSLPMRLLEELRVLSNVTADGSPQLRLVLAGTTALDELLTDPQLASFSQRIAARCYLAPLSYDETAQYVRAHIAAAGGDPDTLLAADAYQAIHAASDGVPRMINQVGDRALVLAVEHGESQITATAVQAAWSDLNQLPAPWHSPSTPEPAAHEASVATSVEFGPLDDLDGEPLEIEPLEQEASGSTTVDPALLEEPTAVTMAELESDDDDPLPIATLRAGKPSDEEREEQPVEGIWNADAGLPIAARKAAREVEDSAEACVSLAFPGVHAAATDPGDDESAKPKDAPADPVADDPFEESFEEEEVLLDRYSDLAAVTPAGQSSVINRQDIEFGKLFQGLDPAVESLVAEIEGIDTADSIGFKVLQAAPPVARAMEPTPVVVEEAPAEYIEVSEEEEAEQVVADAEEPGPVLVVEDEPDTKPAGAQRREYTQLFASLRQG